MRKLMVAVALAVLAGLAGAQAQTFPSRPITLVLALPAGGAVDALARIMVEHMRGTLGQPVIIENMGGAGGTLSIARVVRSAPDGYTLGMGTLGQYVISGAVYTLPFDMLADLAPVALLPNVPYWMATRKTLPANNLRELATWLKSNNGSAASTGTASMARFCGMGFEKATGTTLQYVPYRGGAPALNDLVAGQIDLDCDLAANSLAQYRAGNIKALAVMTKTRWAAAPDVPTRRRGRLPRSLLQHLARHLGAQGHAGRYRRQDQRCRDGRDGRSGDAAAHRRSRHGHCRRPSSRRRRRSPPSTRPRSRNGIRS